MIVFPRILEKKLLGENQKSIMFVVIAEIKLKNELKSEFKEWFSESNKVLSKLDGFVSRRLLESDDGSHRIIVEHKNKETFTKMHQSPEHERLHQKAITFMTSPPSAKFYNVVSS